MPTTSSKSTPKPTPTPTPPPSQARGLGRSPWLLALAVLVILGVIAGAGWLLVDRSSGEQTFEDGGVRMSIPEDWTLENTALNQACQTTPTLTCVAILTAPQGYNFSVTWYEQAAEVDVQTVDEQEWKKFVEYYPNAILFNRLELEVGGLPAIQRTFMQNNPMTTPVYFRQIYVVDGLRLYLITARFDTAELMETYGPVIDAAITSIHFTGE